MPGWITGCGRPGEPPPGARLNPARNVGPSHAAQNFRVALLVPECGSAGLWGPSCIASAQIAADQLNRTDGIAGREVELLIVDSAIEAHRPAENIVAGLIETRGIDAVVGMHISAVRQRLTRVIQGRIPYVYTPLYEGGERSPGVFAIGETPATQLGPAIQHLHCKRRVRKWALIGNDYVWPRVSHRYARQKLAALGADLLYERYVPFAWHALAQEAEAIADSGADAVLISLVGQDAVDFNRIFGAMALDRAIIRLSCAIEENILLASGSENLKRMFCASSYFGALNTPGNASFRELYHGFHGDRAPTLNALGQSTWEGLQFLAGLMQGEDWPAAAPARQREITWRSARQAVWRGSAGVSAPTYLARADGVTFRIVSQLS